MSSSSRIEVASLKDAENAAVLALQLNNLDVVSEKDFGFSYQFEVGRCGGPTAFLDVRFCENGPVYTVHGEDNEMKRELAEMFEAH